MLPRESFRLYRLLSSAVRNAAWVFRGHTGPCALLVTFWKDQLLPHRQRCVCWAFKRRRSSWDVWNTRKNRQARSWGQNFSPAGVALHGHSRRIRSAPQKQRAAKTPKKTKKSAHFIHDASYDALYVTTSNKSRRKTLTFANIPGCESPRFPPDYLAAPPTSTAAPRSYPPSPSTKLLLETQLSRRTPRSVTKRLRCYPHTRTKCACTPPLRS